MPKRKSSKPTKGSKSQEETKADAILSKISSDFLECTICLEPFKDPKVLPCLHTFCEGCLKKFVAQDKVKNKFHCPTCRIETVLPKGGVASFKNNFFVQSLSDTVQAHKSLVSKEDDKVQCDVCEEDVASRGCVPCEEFLCDECASAHYRAKRTRSHEVIGVVELKEQLITKTGSLKSKSLPTCPKHEDEKMKFYCETCKCPICRDCSVLQHKNHKYGYLADTVGKVRAEIKTKLKAAKQKITKYEKRASVVAKKQAELDTRSKKAKESIGLAAKKEIKHFTGLVKCNETELNEKLASITTDRSKLLSATADSIRSTLGCLSSTVDFSQKVVEHGSDFDLMNMYSDVTSRLESLLEGPTPDIPDDISYVMFDPKTERKEKGVILGSIVDKEIVDDEMEGESQAEATFRFTVDNFSKLKQKELSNVVFIRNLPWRVYAEPYYVPNGQPPYNKHLAVFLQCEADAKSLWSCHASAELRLIPQKKGVKKFISTVDQNFYNNGSSWGRKEFMPWHEVCDPKMGYIKDDKIILEAYVKADAPCGEKEITIDSEEMEEEPQSQATVRFTMENVSKVTERKFSHAVFIQNLPWKILAKPSGDSKYAWQSREWQPNKNLAVFLHCDADSKSLWSCHASAELRLIPQKIGVQPLTHNIDQIFYNKDRSGGTTHFMPWHELCDPQKGYIKDDKIILEAHVKADAPRGMKEIALGNIFGEEIHEKTESVAEATIHFTVENFSEVKELERRYSNPVFVRNLPWKILAKHEEDTKSQPPNKKTLGVYLKCDANSNSFWSCRASVEFRLIPQKAGVNIHKMVVNRVFYKNGDNWGYSKFMPWHEVCDPQKGYIKNNKIMLEAYVKADAPCILAGCLKEVGSGTEGSI
ncbi:PREDICTED: uncharacterized protein LOC109476912 [Branchiostoma belcheri]|uniref:Uncharacterized protein LOC109476912 n=1 Tax=Branchiostoma belcheri TaxID=7741 RepID=A0A6P4ZHI3_BRABE|nr:PREDICTED: uncharacterized protein LOC109476912 [Branchiostoma belcheri]